MAVCIALLAACGSEPSARPGGDTTTTSTTIVQSEAESTTTTARVVTTRPPPTMSPLLAPPVTASLGGQPATLRRVDVPLALNAPVNLVAASPSGVVAIGSRSVGCCQLGVTAAFSTDGLQWRTIVTGWEAPEIRTDAFSSFGSPAALAYGDGKFLSVGQRFDSAPDGKQIAFAYAARSSNGINWESIDLRSSLGSLHPTQLVRLGGRWIMAAESWDATGPPQTPLYSSTDGASWERIATLDARFPTLVKTDFGLVAVGGEINSPLPFSAVSVDGRTWRTATIELGPFSSLSSVLLDGERMVLVMSERAGGNSTAQRVRLLSSRDGLTWQSIPTPPCFVAGDYVGPAAVVGGTWAIVVDTETPTLAVSHDQGATWSCNNLAGATFETNPSWGPPYLTSISEVQDRLALVGGRTIEPGAKGNWAAAIWYLS